MGKNIEYIKYRNFKLKLDRTLVMGILNITPDSFSDGGLFFGVDSAIEHAKKMIEEGADIIDVGGESTKPGSEPLPEEEELKRLMPVIKNLAGKINVPISIDTYKPKVAEKCIELGADMLNDITGLRNEEMRRVAGKNKIPVVIMHMKGEPKGMQQAPNYDDVVKEIKDFFRERIKQAKEAGIDDIILDPGIGFGKTTLHNIQILKRLNEFREFGCPILIGPSRKSFIGSLTGAPVNERLAGTLASVSIAVMNGANIVRVHDVKECKRAVRVADAIRNC